jgi:hypothetical protein
MAGRTGRSLKASSEGIKLAKAARMNFPISNKVLAETLGMCRSVLQNFFAGKPVGYENFLKICDKLKLSWQEIAELPRTEGKEVNRDNSTSDSQVYPPNPEPNFVGRESASTNSSASSSVPAQQNYNETPQRRIWIPNTRCRRVWGRDNLMEQILNHLNDPQELFILSLSGSAGYGKTEAASQIAKTALTRNLFADVLWVTARQTELVDGLISQEQRGGVLDWNRFLHEIAHQLACPVERVQQRLREEKLLIVLDNAETANVKDILTNLVKMLNPSRALLTSRLKTNLQFVKLIPIQGLDEASAYQLLRDEAKNKDIPILLQADDEQLYRVHQLSCGAPLALHFIVGRVWDDRTLEPVLSALEQASGEVEAFYEFSLNTAWQRISDVAKCVLRYMGRADASITWAELSGAWGVLDSDWSKAHRELRRWYLIEDVQDVQGNRRYDLHPWVRSSVRGGLVDNWQPSLHDLERITKWKYDL